MQYTLMLRDTPAAEIDIEISEGGKISLLEVYDMERLPIAVQFAENKEIELERYLTSRVIPEERENFKKLLEISNSNNITILSLRNHMLSLQDQYWVKADGDIAEWKDINYFDNCYSNDIGNVLFGYDIPMPQLNSPDISTNGRLMKTWRKKKGENYLLKMGSFPYYQEPYNEVFASFVAEKCCTVDFVKYRLFEMNGKKGSICPSFLNEHTSLVTAKELYRIFPVYPGEGVYEHLIRTCSEMGIKKSSVFFDAMIAFDYIIGNFDRHLDNFGFLYDTEKMKFTGPAPLYDNGSSLWGDCPTEYIDQSLNDRARPFAECHDDQMKYIRHISKAVKREGLESLKDLLPAVMGAYDEERAEKLSEKFNQHIDKVQEKIQQMEKEEVKHEYEKKFKKEIER